VLHGLPFFNTSSCVAPFIRSLVGCYTLAGFQFFVSFSLHREKTFDMNKEILYIAEQMKDAFAGDPWFGRNAKALLSEVNERNAFEKPNGQHSILELVWHMTTWRAFVISRFTREAGKDQHYFESRDWRELDHNDKSLWQQGLQLLQQTQEELIALLQKQSDDLLDRKVEERNYTYRKLLYGVVQHDIYHLGQITYILKLLRG
jgi:uncharacterized damage-inducible protein DinB